MSKKSSGLQGKSSRQESTLAGKSSRGDKNIYVIGWQPYAVNPYLYLTFGEDTPVTLRGMVNNPELQKSAKPENISGFSGTLSPV